MDNVDLSILRQVADWHAQGHRVVLATVTRTWGSAPRPIGSVVAVREDGQIAGSVSGGCIEDDLMAQVRDHGLAMDCPTLTRYGVGAEEARQFGLPCGGTMELVLEPVSAASRIPELLQRLAEGRLVRRVLSLSDGSVRLEDAGPSEELALTDSTLTTTHGPRWRLLVIGAGQMTSYLASMARALDYEVLICDPRPEYAEAWNVPGARLLRGMPDDVVNELKPDGHTAVIALTHDPKLDDLALMEALGSDAFYVGAIGSRVNQAKRKARLAEHFGVTPQQLARLHGPVGLKNGARTPPEIAVSILAELTAVRYGYAVPEPVPTTEGPRADVGCVLEARDNRPMLQLHYYPSNASMAPHILLQEMGVPFELKRVDREGGELQSPAYLKLNPNGLIPVLVDGDTVLYEGAAICMHLADTHPEQGLMPALGTPQRAHAYKWLAWLSNTLQPALITYYYPERWVDEGNADGAAQVKRRAEARVGVLLQQLDDQLAAHGGDWLLGDAYSVCDPYAFMLCRWTRNFAAPARSLPHLGPYLQRVMQRPAVQRAIATEGLQPPIV